MNPRICLGEVMHNFKPSCPQLPTVTKGNPSRDATTEAFARNLSEHLS